MKTWTAKKIQDANNETATVGITQMRDSGPYTAMTFTKSKDFKTFDGARKWLAQRGYTIPNEPDAP